MGTKFLVVFLVFGFCFCLLSEIYSKEIQQTQQQHPPFHMLMSALATNQSAAFSIQVGSFFFCNTDHKMCSNVQYITKEPLNMASSEK